MQERPMQARDFLNSWIYLRKTLLIACAPVQVHRHLRSNISRRREFLARCSGWTHLELTLFLQSFPCPRPSLLHCRAVPAIPILMQARSMQAWESLTRDCRAVLAILMPMQTQESIFQRMCRMTSTAPPQKHIGYIH